MFLSELKDGRNGRRTYRYFRLLYVSALKMGVGTRETMFSDISLKDSEMKKSGTT